MKLGHIYLLHKTNQKRELIIAALHWRWSITWRWLLIYSLPTKIQLWHGWNGNPHTGHFMYCIYTPIGNLFFQTQRNMKRRSDYEKLPLAR